MRRLLTVGVLALLVSGCYQGNIEEKNSEMIKIMTAAPGHFHAALVQKNMYPGVDSQVYVYAPAGPEVEDYLSRIEAFNKRADDPTGWESKVYTGEDFFEKISDLICICQLIQ